MRHLQAHCHLGLGKLYRKAGRPEETRVNLLSAIELYRTMEMMFRLSKVEAALAQTG